MTIPVQLLINNIVDEIRKSSGMMDNKRVKRRLKSRFTAFAEGYLTELEGHYVLLDVADSSRKMLQANIIGLAEPIHLIIMP